MIDRSSNNGASKIASPLLPFSGKVHAKAWYQPLFSPEHGVYIMLLIFFLTGAAAAKSWTLATTLALICAFFGFQAEHPLVLQIRQRRSLKPHFLVWGGLYSAISLFIAVWLFLKFPVLIWLYLGAAIALVMDAISVFEREQKSIFNELITFAAVCLSTPFAYVATTGTISVEVMALGVLNALYFSSSIFIVKLRKAKTSSLVPGMVYHAVATALLLTLHLRR